MGLDKLELEVKSTSGTEEEKIAAKRIMPLLRNHHQLLATLLLGNAICFESLPIFMDAIMPSWAAILISTTFILIVGEVVPQALCVGPQQLQIASKSSPLVSFLMTVTCCITVPVGRALDHFLGVHEEYRYDKQTLISIVGLHARKGNKILRESPQHITNQLNLRMATDMVTTMVTVMEPAKDLSLKSSRSSSRQSSSEISRSKKS